MPNLLDANGLTTKDYNELVADLGEIWKRNFGNDVIIDSNSIDGQLINIFSLAIVDVLQRGVSIFNSFSLDNATGIVLDERASLFGIERQEGSFSQQQINITNDKNINLKGLDANYNDPSAIGYTVADNNGNQFILIDSVSLAPGIHNLTFRAKDIGAISTIPNTITNQVTREIGVTAVNNPSGVLELGQDEQTDAQLRFKMSRSKAQSSIGYLDGLQGGILNVIGVVDAKVYENLTNITDLNGIPPHSIWAIVDGGANTDIANVIYSKKSFGSDMKGNVEIYITTMAGQIFTARFDRPTGIDLYIRFDIQRTIAGQTFDQTSIKNYIVSNLKYTIGEQANTANITGITLSAINNTSGGGVPVNLEISSDGTTWVDFLTVPNLDKKWIVNQANISIAVLP